jgi:hypothetical protein
MDCGRPSYLWPLVFVKLLYVVTDALASKRSGMLNPTDTVADIPTVDDSGGEKISNCELHIKWLVRT